MVFFMNDSFNLICIGESLIELSTPESLNTANTLNKFYGGDTISSAVTASKLGSKVGYITRVGNDYFKDFLLESWQIENIDTSYVKLVSGYNGLYFSAIAPNQEKEFAYYRKKTAGASLSIDDINPDYIEKADIVYSTGITQSLSTSAKEAVKESFEIAKEKECLVAYDPNFSPRLWDIEEAKEALEEVIEYVDIIFLNIKNDAEKLLGLNSEEKIIKHLWDRGVNTVIIKKGAQGATIGYNGEIKEIEAYESEVVDTMSSGDVFNGGYLHGITNGYTPFDATKLACVVAGLQVQKIGAIQSIPTKEAVLEEFNKND